MEKTINSKQFALIAFVVCCGTKVFMLPALLLSLSGRDSYIPLFVYLLAEFFILLMLIVVIKKHPDKNLYQLLEGGIGKVGARILAGILIVYYVIKLTLLVSETKIFFTVSATSNLSWTLCIFPLLAALGMVALKSLRDIGRLTELFIPFIVLSMLIMGLIMVKNVEISNLLPVFENGPINIFYSMLKLPMWMADFSVLAIFIGKVDKKSKHLMSVSLISCVVASFAVMFFGIMMFATYGNVPKLLDYGHNITNMAEYSTGSYDYGRFDIVVFCIWMVSVFIHMSLLFYSIVRHFSYITTIKNNYISVGIFIVVMFVMITLVFPDEQKLYSFSASVFSYAAFLVEQLFPVFLFVLGMALKRSERKKGGGSLLNET